MDALAALADPRAVIRLLALAEDLSVDVVVRGSALDVLAQSGLCPEGPTLREWWASGDVELQKQALIEAERTEIDILGPVAKDPSHPLHAQAIWGLEAGFDEPEWQDCKINALSHSSVAVRKAAATTLMWDEPIRAEEALQRTATEPDLDVAVPALETLEYYWSRSTVLALYDLAQPADDRRAETAQQSFDRIRDEFLAVLHGTANEQTTQRRLLQWMEPVWVVLGFKAQDCQPPPPEPRDSPDAERRPPPPSSRALLGSYGDLDGPWAAKLRALRRYDWTATPSQERKQLPRFFATHLDPAVRDAICGALAQWQDTDTLIQLAHDDLSWVRKSAVYYLHDVPQSREVAELTWDLISSGEVASTRGQEALRTYEAHAPKRESKERLLDLALTDQRESIRYQAVHLIPEADIGPTLSLLAEPPLVTWAVHTALLAICSSSGIAPPPITHLWEVDNLQVVEALAGLESR